MTLRYRIEDVALDGPRLPGEMQVSFTIPVRTAPGQNAREHHMERARRVKRERDAVLWCWPRQPVPVPCVVSLFRRSPKRGRQLDKDDNLPGSLKAIKDELARLLGVDDADPRVEWRYHQDVGAWGVYVLICAGAGGQVLPELPRRRPAARPAKPRLQLLARAQAQAGFKVTPNFIPARKP